MLHPAPTSRIDPTTARGELAESHPAAGANPAHVVLTFPNTNYRTHLLAAQPVTTPVGKRILGTIRVQARRVDTVHTGGRYVEPVYGRPRRVQGSVIAADTATRTIVIDAGFPIHCELTDARQRADDFQPGQFVSCDVLDGATFTPASTH